MQTPLKAGDRIRLISMTDDPDPVPRGALGTVRAVRHHRYWVQVEVAWDNGRELMLCLPDDCVAIIPEDAPASDRS